MVAALSTGAACHRTGHRLIGTRLCKLLSSRLKHGPTHHRRLALDPFQFVSLHQVGLESKAVFWAETHAWPGRASHSSRCSCSRFWGPRDSQQTGHTLVPHTTPCARRRLPMGTGLGLLECRRTHCIFPSVIQFWCPSPVF